MTEPLCGPIADELATTGDALFRRRSYMPLVLVPSVRAQRVRRSPADAIRMGARLLCGGALRAAVARVCRRHRAARHIDARHAAPDGRVAVDARRVFDRAPSALCREHARRARMRAALGHVVSAAHRRAVELHLSRAHRRARRSVSADARSATAFAHGRATCPR